MGRTRDDTEMGGQNRRLQSVTTFWDDIYKLRSTITVKQRTDLMNFLAQRYRGPLYRVALHDAKNRAKLSHHDAEDAIQEFFERQLFDDLLARADKDKATSGFRGFLRVCWENFLKNRQRGHLSGEAPVSLNDPDGLRFEPYTTVTAEQVFDRYFYLELVTRALSRLRETYQVSEAEECQAYLDHLYTELSYKEISRHRSVSVKKVKHDLERFRRRFGNEFKNLLSDEFGVHAMSNAEAEQEIKEALAELFGQSDFF